MSNTIPTPQSVEQVDPRTLLVDVNVRTDARVDAPLVDSIRDWASSSRSWVSAPPMAPCGSGTGTAARWPRWRPVWRRSRFWSSVTRRPPTQTMSTGSSASGARTSTGSGFA